MCLARAVFARTRLCSDHLANLHRDDGASHQVKIVSCKMHRYNSLPRVYCFHWRCKRHIQQIMIFDILFQMILSIRTAELPCLVKSLTVNNVQPFVQLGVNLPISEVFARSQVGISFFKRVQPKYKVCGNFSKDADSNRYISFAPQEQLFFVSSHERSERLRMI